MTRFLLRRELISTILNQGNTILHYRNYLYILNLLFFGRCSPNGELYWRDPEPVGGWRGQGGPWPQDVVPVNEQNCNSRTSGSRFVHCPRSFYFFSLHPRMSSCMTNFANSLPSSWKCWASYLYVSYIYVHILMKFGVKCKIFPLYTQRRTEIQWMCWG